MYTPAAFAEHNLDTLHALIDAHPLSTLVSMKDALPEVNHIPLLLSRDASPYGTLCGHIARANPIWQEHPSDIEIIAVFHGPEAYISPSWYASKAETGKVVPTWNYTTVHAKGRVRFIQDATWLLKHLDALTAHNEQAFSAPWKLADAPTEFINQLLPAIVGIEIQITSLHGKWKASQNRSASDRQSVAAGLTMLGLDNMATLVTQP